jgi:hypothetical protein
MASPTRRSVVVASTRQQNANTLAPATVAAKEAAAEMAGEAMEKEMISAEMPQEVPVSLSRGRTIRPSLTRGENSSMSLPHTRMPMSPSPAPVTISVEETLQRVLAPAGLALVEAVETDGESSYVKTFNTFGQVVFVEVPNTSPEGNLVPDMTYRILVEPMKESEEVTMGERSVMATQGLLTNGRPMICGHGAEMGDGFCLSTPSGKTVFTTVESEGENYGHTAGNAVPAPIVTLNDVMMNPGMIESATKKETFEIQRASVNEAREQLARLAEVSARLGRASQVAIGVFEKKLMAVGKAMELVKVSDIKLGNSPPTPDNIKRRSAAYQNLIHLNYLLSRLIGHAYYLQVAELDVEHALAVITDTLTEVNAETQNISRPIDGLPISPF